jgi:hypothetical protein
MSLSDAHGFRRMVAGTCMVLAPLFLLVGAIVHPGLETGAAAQVAVAEESRSAFFIGTLLVWLSIPLAVAAVLGLMHMLRERETALGHLGGALGLIGLVAFACMSGIAFVIWQMGAAGAEQAQMAALLDRVRDSAGIIIPVYLMSIAFAGGMLAFMAGFMRSKVMPAPVAAAIGLGGVCVVLAWPVAATWLLVVGAALLTVGFGATGLTVLRESDSDWEHTPEFRGMRPAGGAA